MRSGNNVVTAVVVLLILVGGAGGFKLYQRGRALEGDLVITGRTPPFSSGPKVPVAQPGTPAHADAAVAPLKSEPAPAEPKPPAEVVVHVAGAVRRPGLYHLSAGARVDDALKAAGGAKSEANLDAVNLAAHAEDGTQLYVPTRSEQPQGGAPATPAPTPPTSHPAKTVAQSSGHGEKLTSPSQGTVNVNTASAEQLERLPGVGPSYALRIIEFRKANGPFTNPEQLMDVSGIGEKKFAKMRPFVRIR
jgi:competence protein ComEA